MTLEEKLAGWTGPSSSTEQDKQERTERMIREAVAAHRAFDGVSLSVYAKGSYANNTNVKLDSDVDVAVECGDAIHWGERTPGAHPASTPYTGVWTPAQLRAELVAAMQAKFSDSVDTSGSTAIRVDSSSARVEADVVPCFEYHYYFEDGTHRVGAKVFRKDGASTENYSKLQLQHGTAKNNRTSTYYKKTVRILKRVENVMVENGTHREVPSFFIECLVFNCPDAVFAESTWTETVRETLRHIWSGLQGDIDPTAESERWLEVNEAKFLFSQKQKWTRADGRDFAYAAWNYLGLDEG